MAVAERRGWGEADDAIERYQASIKSNAFDFYLKPGGSADIVFLDDEPVIRYLHAVKKDPDRKSRAFEFFCLESDDCPGCKLGNRAAPVGLFTMLELTHLPARKVKNPDPENDDDWELIKGAREIKTRDGGIVRNPVRLLVAKRDTLMKLSKFHERRDGLLYWRYHIERSEDDKSPKVGDFWDSETLYEEEQVKMLNPDAAPLDYEKVEFARSADEIVAELRGARNGRDEDEDDDPPPRRRSRDEDEDKPRRRARKDDDDDDEPPRRDLKW